MWFMWPCVALQSPADYYLRVMMREYQFEPASQMISVGEGDTVTIQVTGRRVEYRYVFFHSFISGMRHYECIVPNVDIILKSG